MRSALQADRVSELHRAAHTFQRDGGRSRCISPPLQPPRDRSEPLVGGRSETFAGYPSQVEGSLRLSRAVGIDNRPTMGEGDRGRFFLSSLGSATYRA